MNSCYPHVRRAVILLFLVALSIPAGAQDERPRSIDLAAALALARENSPQLQAARARIGEAAGDLTHASLLLVENPELQLAAGPRFLNVPGEGTEIDADVGLAQRFETGGQRRHRITSARALATETRAQLADLELAVSTNVATNFYEVLAAAERLRLREESAALAESLYEEAHSRVAAGAAAPLEENSARIRNAEAKRQRIRAEASLRNAKVRLVSALGLSPKSDLRPTGTLPEVGSLPPLSDLIAQTVERHPRIVAARAAVDAAQSAVALANAEAWPDVSLGVSYSRDEKDDIVMGGVTIPIAVFDRNQGGRQRANASSRRASAIARSAQLDVESVLRRSYAEYEAANRSVRVFDADVLRSYQDNLELIEAMYRAGKIRYGEVALFQRELIEGRLGYLDSRLDLARAEAAARAAAGIDLNASSPGRSQP